MFTEEQIQGNLNTVDRQLLYDIRGLLQEQNALLRALGNENNREAPDENKTRGRGRAKTDLKEASA